MLALSRGLQSALGPRSYFRSKGPGNRDCLMLNQREKINGEERSALGHASCPWPYPLWILFLPGGFSNKVREGKVPVIIQPRFHPVLVPLLLRLHGAGAGSFHGVCCASQWLPGAGFPPGRVPLSEERDGARDPPLLPDFRLAVLLRSLRAAGKSPSTPCPAPPGPRGSQVAGALVGVPRRPAFCICRGSDWRALRKPSGPS